MSFLASRMRSAPEGVGKPVRRREDPRLIDIRQFYPYGEVGFPS
jgi:hypothetical protein